MSAAERELYRRLRRRAALLQPDLARRLLAAYEAIRLALTDAELAVAIQSGQAEALINEVMSDPKAGVFSQLRQMLDETVIGAAKAEAAKLPPSIQVGAFNVVNRHVLTAAVKLDTEVVQGLADEVRNTVRLYVMDGLQSGKNPREIARATKKYIGLSYNQMQYIENFRHELETGDPAALSRVLGRGMIRTPDGSLTFREAHAGGRGVSSRDITLISQHLGSKRLTETQIDRITSAYRDRWLALNTEAHTRTMALQAQRIGARQSWEDAITQGTVDRSQLRRTWVAVDDNRTRPEHRALDGTTITWDATYPNGEMVPGESTYNCRCIERVTIVHEQALAA